MRAVLAAALLLPSAAAFGAVQWNESVSPHFVVKHEAPFPTAGLTLELERLHNRLRLDLAMFAPWMAKERVTVYLYTKQQNYLRGEFHPPGWSNGIAQYEDKMLATFEEQGKDKLYEVIGHEMTHLLFEGYWGEVKKRPPTWLNEGLAMLEEKGDKSDGPRSEWYRAMSMFYKQAPYRFEDFLSANPSRDLGGDQDKVTRWYVQSYSLVFFLYRRHTRLQFFNFCRAVRDGSTVAKALASIYRYRSTAELEKAWRAWLNEPAVRRELQEYEVIPRNSASAGGRKSASKREGKLRSVGFQGLEFHQLR